MSFPFVRAGLLRTSAEDVCLHCSRTLAGAGRCACSLERDDLRPNHGVAEVLFSATHTGRALS